MAYLNTLHNSMSMIAILIQRGVKSKAIETPQVSQSDSGSMRYIHEYCPIIFWAYSTLDAPVLHAFIPGINALQSACASGSPTPAL